MTHSKNTYNGEVMGKKKKIKNKRTSRYKKELDGYGIEYDEDYAFIAGFSEGGAPFGITHEEMKEIEREERQFEQKRKRLTDPSLDWVDSLLANEEEAYFLFADEDYDSTQGSHYSEYEEVITVPKSSKKKKAHSILETQSYHQVREILAFVQNLDEKAIPYQKAEESIDEFLSPKITE